MSGRRPPRLQRRRKRILVVDDHPIMREGVARWIEQDSSMMICGEAASVEEALVKIPLLHPDLILADLTLPDRSGLELIAEVNLHHRPLPVLVLSMHDENLYADRVLRAGGRGYLMKHLGGKEVTRAIRLVLNGGIYCSPSVTARALGSIARRRPSAKRDSSEQLTSREFEILDLIGQAKTNQEIARALGVSPKTIETHRQNIKAKLGLKNAPELIRYAIRKTEG